MGLIQEIYETPFDEGSWSKVATLLEHEFNANSSALLVANPADTQLKHSSVRSDVVADYNDRLWKNDLWLQRSLNNRAGTVVTGLNLAGQEAFTAEYRSDVFHRSDCADSMCAMLVNDRAEVAMLSLYRSGRFGPYSAEEQAQFLTIVPHMIRAYRIGAELRVAKSHSAVLEGMLSDHQQVLFLVDRQGNVVWSNAAAEEEFKHATILSIRNGKVRAGAYVSEVSCTAAGTRSLPEAIAAKGGSSIVLKSLSANRVLHVSQISPHIASAFGVSRPDLPLLLVAMKRSVANTRLERQLLADHFQLTAREIDVALGLAAGMTISEIAGMHASSVDTVRSQLKGVMLKTDTHRQSELVKCVLELRG